MALFHHKIPGIFQLLLSVFVVGILSTSLADAQSKTRTPNIVFIICDQMRADAIGAAGNPNAKTPNIDHLAANGVLFRNNFANNPVCLPSRISMFSGLYPSQTGILCNKHQGEWLSYNRSLPWYFKQAGYHTGYIGKNHSFEKFYRIWYHLGMLDLALPIHCLYENDCSTILEA